MSGLYKLTPDIEKKFLTVNYYINRLYDCHLIDGQTRLRMQRYSFLLYDVPQEEIIKIIDRWTDNITNKTRSR